MFVYEKMWVVAGVFVNIGVRERSFMFVYERILTAKKKVKQFGKLFGVPILFYKQFWSAQTILQTVWSAQTILQTV